jgi:membrane-bound serine protease (ClpP class)
MAVQHSFSAEPIGSSGAEGLAVVQVLNIRGVIGPATADFVRSGVAAAREQGAPLIILAMDTPGGLAESMRTIIHSILASPVPVAAFVHPSGSRAASAGTYILYAAHIAAMAPGTNLGAATPVQIGGGLPLPGKEPQPGDEDEEAPASREPPRDAMAAKIVNDAAAYIRSLAEMRGRNAEWAERSVREGVSLAVNDALEQKVIDVVAADIPELLEKIDGRTVKLGERRVTLETAGLDTNTIQPGWRIRLLSFVTNPNIAFILILVGVYGLIFEFANPGAVGPGVVGVICLLVGFYALNVLPVNHAGLGLLFFAIALMVAEAFVPSFGVLGIGGIVAFVLAATMLFKGDIPGFRLSWPVIATAAAVSGGLMIFVLGYAFRAQRRPVSTGVESLVGRPARVLEWSGGGGYVRLEGERWKAVGEGDLAPQERVEVLEARGLVLVVQKKQPQLQRK